MTPEPLPPAEPPAGLWWGRLGPELRWHAEMMRLLVDPVFHGRDVPRGDGRPVVVLPGFAAGDYTLGPMVVWLRRMGYAASTCGIWLNADCGERALQRIELRVEAVQREHGRRVAVIGHSRGGYLARALGAGRPDLVSHVIALGSGLRSQHDVAAPALAAVALVRAVHRRTTDRALRRGCMTEACACAFTTAYAAPFPPDVRLTSIYSRGDGMVRWQSCVVPYAENVEVTGSHVGLAFNRKTYRAIAQALGSSPSAGTAGRSD
jgi:pimeloyl-ACP methyl ester carboxylesterase